MMWASIDQRKIINSSVIILSIIIVSLVGQWGRSTYLEYIEARDMVYVNRVTDDLIRASNLEAVERGLTSLLLSESNNAGLSEIREQITQLRLDGDAIWLNAQALILQLQQRDEFNNILSSELQ
ncbi:MAG: hypothetical protein OQK46_09220, partial [Gammaproteobacteria bacterium]|nr:hypothetical protein [Gammaproteobacteria bacterium]